MDTEKIKATAGDALRKADDYISQKTVSEESRLFGALCYIIVVILPLFVLFTDKKRDRFLAFHSYQSLILFALVVAYSFILGIIGFMFGMVSKALGILLIPLYWAPLLVFLLMAYHAWKGRRFRFPAVGDEAAKLSG